MKWDEDPAPKVMYPCGQGHGISQEPFGDGFGYKGIRTDGSKKIFTSLLAPLLRSPAAPRARTSCNEGSIRGQALWGGTQLPWPGYFNFCWENPPVAGSCTSDAAEGTSSLSIFLLNFCGRFAASPLWGLFGEIWQGKQRVQLAPETRSLAWHGRVGL